MFKARPCKPFFFIFLNQKLYDVKIFNIVHVNLALKSSKSNYFRFVPSCKCGNRFSQHMSLIHVQHMYNLFFVPMYNFHSTNHDDKNNLVL